MLDRIAEPLLPYAPGILATRSIIDAGIEGIGEQFRDQAATYEERYADVERKAANLERGLSAANVRLGGRLAVLDIGCGAGDMTVAVLRAFPEVRVWSTDLSPEMLNLLVRRAEPTGVRDRITPFVANASQVALRAEGFDLVVGSSMIHHLIEPGTFLDRTLQSVKRGGVALFYEPFAAGHIVLRTLLRSLTQLAGRSKAAFPQSGNSSSRDTSTQSM